jgi:hypothetical protein
MQQYGIGPHNNKVNATEWVVNRGLKGIRLAVYMAGKFIEQTGPKDLITG